MCYPTRKQAKVAINQYLTDMYPFESGVIIEDRISMIYHGDINRAMQDCLINMSEISFEKGIPTTEVHKDAPAIIRAYRRLRDTAVLN